METNEPISPAEASAALALTRGSRARVAWVGYPSWYWLGTAATLAALPVATLVPDWLGRTIVAAVAVLGVVLAVGVNRIRGVCEGWTRGAMPLRDGIVLYVPALVVVLAGSFASKFASKFASWPPITASVLGFVLFAGTWRTLSVRATHR